VYFSDGERLLQEKMDKDPTCRSFSWKVLRQAKMAVNATTYVGDTALTAPPFFDNAVRGDVILCGTRSSGPRVINWTGLSQEDQVEILPTLRLTSDWILFALAGKTKPDTTPFLLEGSKKAMTTQGKASRKRKWWQSGDDELAEYDKRVEVLVSSKNIISEDSLGDLEALLNSNLTKDNPHNGTEGVESNY